MDFPGDVSQLRGRAGLPLFLWIMGSLEDRHPRAAFMETSEQPSSIWRQPTGEPERDSSPGTAGMGPRVRGTNWKRGYFHYLHRRNFYLGGEVLEQVPQGGCRYPKPIISKAIFRDKIPLHRQKFSLSI